MTDTSLGMVRRVLACMLSVLLAMTAPVAALAEAELVDVEDVALARGEETPVSDVALTEDDESIAGDEAEAEDAEAESDSDGGAEQTSPVEEVVSPDEEPAATDEQPSAEEGLVAEEPQEGEATEEEAVAEEELEVAGTPLPTPPANAAEVDAGTYLLQATFADTLLIEAQGSSPSAGAVVRTAAYSAAKNKRWIVERYQDTVWYRLRLAANTELALGVESATSGAAVTAITVTSDDQAETLWAFVPNTDGTLRLVSAANTKLALSVKGSSTKAGTAMTLASSKGTANQRVALVADAPVVEAGTKGLEGAYVLTEKKSGLAATVKGAAKTNGANLQLNAGKNLDNQKIYLEPVDGGGYYIAWVIGTGKVLSVKGNNLLAGANVHQWSYNKSNAQKWAVRKGSDGRLKFYNKGTGLALAAEGTAEGTNLAGAVEASAFAAKRIALLKKGIVEIKPETSSAVSVSVAKASAKSGASIVLWKDTDALNQRFELISAGKTDLWRVRTASSGGYLTVNGGVLSQQGKGATKANATNVWRVTFRGGGYGLMLNDGSSKALNLTGGKTAKGTKVGVASANGSDAQHFAFTDAKLLKTGVHFLKNAKGKMLDVYGGSSSIGANVQTYKKTKSHLFGEYFTIEKAGSYVRIKNTYSELYVTATGKKGGSNVVMKKGSTANSQKWLPQIADGGYVVFRGVGAYKKVALHVSRASAKNGANVVVGKAKGDAAQKWKPIATTYNPYPSYMLKAIRTANASGSATNYMLVVDRAHTRVMIMRRSGAEWELYRHYLCSCGKGSTPTITGSYTVGARGYSFTDGDHTCYYWTEIRGDYLFHSVLYRAGTMDVLDGRLGYHISMGCVRLDINVAKWIYDNIPSGTKIIIY